MGTPPVLSDEDVIELKRNEEGLNVNQWAKRLGVSYRTIQKIVFRVTYRDVGELHESWLDLREKQRPGRKSGGANSRTVQPSELEPHAERIMQTYEAVMVRMADTFDTTPDKLKSFIASRSSMGLRMGRRVKLNTREVMSIRRDMANNMSYAEISAKYGISRPLISKVCGRGKYDAHSYVPSDFEPPEDDTPEVTQEDIEAMADDT